MVAFLLIVIALVRDFLSSIPFCMKGENQTVKSSLLLLLLLLLLLRLLLLLLLLLFFFFFSSVFKSAFNNILRYSLGIDGISADSAGREGVTLPEKNVRISFGVNRRVSARSCLRSSRCRCRRRHGRDRGARSCVNAVKFGAALQEILKMIASDLQLLIAAWIGKPWG